MKPEDGYREVIEAIREHDNFVISSHVQPDGDAIGCALAFGLFLKQLGKRACVRFPDGIPLPHPYEFLSGGDMIVTDTSCPEYEVFVAMECPTLERLGDMAQVAQATPVLLNIDHHLDNDMFGTANLVERDASACATILYKLFAVMGARLTPEIAENLYVGIVTDTGRFQYSSTDSQTFDIARKLLEQGVSPINIFQQVYERQSLHSMRLLGIALARLRFDEDGRVAYTWVTQEDFRTAGAGMEDTENFSNWLRSIDNVEVAFVLKETPNGEVRGSMRSKGDIDAARIARTLGGGGHRNAAGFSAHGDIEEVAKHVVAACREVVARS